MNIPSNREEAFVDTNEKQYDVLKQKVCTAIQFDFLTSKLRL